MSKKSTPISIARNNLKKGFNSPAAKIGSIAAVVGIIGLGGLGVSLFQGQAESKNEIGKADASGYVTNDPSVEGEIANAETLSVIEERMNEKSRAALESGTSNLGIFAFETNKVPVTNLQPDFDESFKPEDAATANLKVDEVIANLRRRAADLDRIDAATAGTPGVARATVSTPVMTGASTSTSGQAQAQVAVHQYGSGHGLSSSMVDAQGRPMPYGISPEDFTQIATQLARVGTGSVAYISAPNGLLSAQQQSGGNNDTARGANMMPAVATSSGNASMDNVVRANASGSADTRSTGKRRLLAEAGAICAIQSESAINTDYPLPAFFEIISCKELTGVRVRGNIQQTPDNFVITFTEFFTTNKHKFKFEGQPQGVSVNINNDGYAGVATDVNNHWFSRIGSAALLNLANTEKEFLNQRGTSTITTGTSSTVAVEPMSEEDKNNARIAGVLQGTMDVITKDTQYGINRKPTMTMPAGTVIGIQFMTNIEATDVE